MATYMAPFLVDFPDGSQELIFVNGPDRLTDLNWLISFYGQDWLSGDTVKDSLYVGQTVTDINGNIVGTVGSTQLTDGSYEFVPAAGVDPTQLPGPNMASGGGGGGGGTVQASSDRALWIGAGVVVAALATVVIIRRR